MKITTINTIETSSVCDNQCAYCPAPIQGQHRAIGHMTIETYKKALVWLKHCVQAGTQRELNLHGIGEHYDSRFFGAWFRPGIPEFTFGRLVDCFSF